MNRTVKPLRLDPNVAGELQHNHNVAAAQLAYATRYRKEFDRQLKQLIGSEGTRLLHKSTENTLLMADLVKEVA